MITFLKNVLLALVLFPSLSFASLTFSALIKDTNNKVKSDISFQQAYRTCEAHGLRLPTMREILSVTESSGAEIKDKCKYPEDEFSCFHAGGHNIYTEKDDSFVWNAVDFVANSKKFAGKRIWTASFNKGRSTKGPVISNIWVQLGKKYESKSPVYGNLGNLPTWFWEKQDRKPTPGFYGVCVRGRL